MVMTASVFARTPCREIIVHMSSLNLSLPLKEQKLLRYLETHAEPMRVFPAARNVYLRLLREGSALPWILDSSAWMKTSSEASDRFEAQWLENFERRASRVVVSEVEPVMMGGAKGGPSSVQRVVVDGKPMVFRPILSAEENPLAFMLYSKLRRTMAAGAFNRLLGISTQPGAEAVRMGSHVGTLSRFITGEPLKIPVDLSPLNSDRLAESLVFEFLVGNRDDLVQNFIRPAQSPNVLMSVDHDLGFSDNIPTYRPKMPIGSSLPEKYPSELVNKLKSITRAQMDESLGQDLLPEEIDQIQIRLEIILEDIRLRS